MAKFFDIRGLASKIVALTVTGSLVISGALKVLDQTPQLGAASTRTVMYIGTTDGCGALIFSASNTTPTLTPTSTALCN